MRSDSGSWQANRSGRRNPSAARQIGQKISPKRQSSRLA
jgi:hypothetical protein